MALATTQDILSAIFVTLAQSQIDIANFCVAGFDERIVSNRQRRRGHLVVVSLLTEPSRGGGWTGGEVTLPYLENNRDAGVELRAVHRHHLWLAFCQTLAGTRRR